MNEATLEKETTKLEKYLIKEGRREFIDEVRVADPAVLDQKILGLAKHREEIKNTKSEDVELTRCIQTKKSLEAPYREQLRMNEKMASFIALIMRERGLE